jgi:hypothetical protein|tara:strand:- start:1110 stop:1943 length:834 start_codon:yes stop_codon:yes gene_type:complete
MENKIEKLKSLLNQCSEQSCKIRETAKTNAEKRFEDANGCQHCRGRGWVVTWDTLDCMHGSYAEYSKCSDEDCTEESRSLSGLQPINNKYDRNRGTMWSPSFSDEVASILNELDANMSNLKNEIRKEEILWQPSEGKVVRVVKPGRGAKDRRVPEGVEGLVIKLHTNNWGTVKAIVSDKDGNKWWPGINQLEVIDPEPDKSHWEELDRKKRETDGYPIVATILKKTARAALIRTTTSKEIWIPYSQVPELKNVDKNSTSSILLPMWLAEKNAFVAKG